MAHITEAIGVERVVEEELAVPVVEVLLHSKADLVKMTLTVHPSCGLSRVLNRRQEDRQQHRDDGDDDQQFDQREPGTTRDRAGSWVSLRLPTPQRITNS